MPHSAESVQMFAILLFHFFYRKKSLEGEKLNRRVTKVKAGQTQMDLPLTFVLIKDILRLEFRIAYF